MNSSVFDFLLTAAPGAADSADFAADWARHRARCADLTNSVDRAAVAGFDSVASGSAFLGGYQEALHALVPALAPDELISMCATEATGARPSAMTTTVTGDGTVTGTKSFATLGTSATRFLVIARAGTHSDGKPSLRAVLVAAGPQAAVTPLPPLPFAPEIPHATVTFTDAPGETLPGDGYADYLKPFRTVEDLHVLAAVLGQLVRVGPTGTMARRRAHGPAGAVCGRAWPQHRTRRVGGRAHRARRRLRSLHRTAHRTRTALGPGGSGDPAALGAGRATARGRREGPCGPAGYRLAHRGRTGGRRACGPRGSLVVLVAASRGLNPAVGRWNCTLPENGERASAKGGS